MGWRDEVEKLPENVKSWVIDIAQGYMRLGMKPSEAYKKALKEIREVG